MYIKYSLNDTFQLRCFREINFTDQFDKQNILEASKKLNAVIMLLLTSSHSFEALAWFFVSTLDIFKLLTYSKLKKKIHELIMS